MTSFIIDPRPIDPPEYYDAEPAGSATIEYSGNAESIVYDEANSDAFYDEIISSIKWAIETGEHLKVFINND